MSRPLMNRREAVQLLGAAAAAQTLAAQTPDICFLTAVEMAGLIRAKKLSAREAGCGTGHGKRSKGGRVPSSRHFAWSFAWPARRS